MFFLFPKKKKQTVKYICAIYDDTIANLSCSLDSDGHFDLRDE